MSRRPSRRSSDGLARNKAAYLRRFYEACFSPGEREARGWFERELLESYLEQMELEALLAGLDYLASASPRRREGRGSSTGARTGSRRSGRCWR